MWTQSITDSLSGLAGLLCSLAMSNRVYCPSPRIRFLLLFSLKIAHRHKKNGILNFFNSWRLIKKLWGFYNHTTDLCHWDTTSVQTLEFLWETGSVLICNRDYNEDKFNCWWQITEPVEDRSAAALPREQLEKQSSILFLLKRFLSLIRKKKKIHFNAPPESFCNPITNLKMQLFW